MQNIERRFVAEELRLFGDNGRTLRGVIKYNTLSEDLGGFRERIAPGAFAKSLGSDIRAFWNHRDELPPLGRTKNNTLRLTDSEHGLQFEIDLPDTTLGNDVAKAIQRGDVDGVSFGFNSSRDNWTEGGTRRTLIEATLYEISPVTYPAYPDSTIALRSLEKWKTEQEPAPEPPKPQRDLGRLLEIYKRKAR